MIRPMRPEDVEAVVAILQENKQMVDGVDYTQWSHPTLVAVHEGTVVGVIQALLGTPYAVMTEFSVAREFQGKQYGVRLLEHMETALRLAGIPAYGAYVSDINDHAADLFERWGGTPTGHGKSFIRRFSQ